MAAIIGGRNLIFIGTFRIFFGPMGVKFDTIVSHVILLSMYEISENQRR